MNSKWGGRGSDNFLGLRNKEWVYRQELGSRQHCFPAGTLVHTEAGLRAIEAVEPGERVWAVDQTSGAWQLCEVQERFERISDGPMMTLTVGGEAIRCTAGHVVWVASGDGLANEYGKKVLPSGPLFRALKVDGNKAVVEFDHVGVRLMVGGKNGRKPMDKMKDGKLARFAISGKEKKWMLANATIAGDTVVCTQPEVPNPVAVRYAFTMNPAGANLYNRDGLPASPFRTDD